MTADVLQPQKCRILTIQSHVVRGYVGNRAAVFPLQYLGFQVDVINSVQFASMFIHEGQTLSGKELEILFEGLLKAHANPTGTGHPGALMEDKQIEAKTDYTHLLTGYIGDGSFLQEVIRFVKRLKAASPHSISWFCDPVMGDNGRLYVPQEVVNVYREEALPLADVILPNHFELQWLSDASEIRQEFSSIEEVFDICAKLHKRGPRIIVVTSVPLEDDPGQLYLAASERVGIEVPVLHFFVIQFPRQKVYLGGTGDLMTAMILAFFEKNHGNLRAACEDALSVLKRVIEQTTKDNEEAHEIDVVGTRHCLDSKSADYTASGFNLAKI